MKQGMAKRKSRENPRDRKCSEDLSDDAKPLPKKSRYELRNKKAADTTWITDDTLDSPSESESEEAIEFSIRVVNKKESEDERPTTRASERKKKTKETPIKLNRQEEDYYNSLPSAKQESLFGIMKRISTLSLDNTIVPYKFKILELPISDYVKSNVIKKVAILDEMSADMGESYKLRNWIDGFLRVPFGKTVPLPIQYKTDQAKSADFIVNARKDMDTSIYAMTPAKTQILQIIAQLLVNPDSVGNVIALQGPMGVGKTSFAKNAIAKVLNRPFEFFSLGGASDIATFIGHSYTYEGSMWGRIVDSLMNSKCMNPVLYFDEVDKVSTTPHGDEIISMLIHLTDRSQNSQFHDRYFSGIDFDVSQCLFVFSFNDIDKVHPILRDRMTVINCDGYTEKDKTVILKNHIWPQISDRLMFSNDELKIEDAAILYMISEFSTNSEKGVRGLIRVVESMLTRLNMLRVANDKTMEDYDFYMKLSFPLTITRPIAEKLLTNLDKKDRELWRSLYT
jgi:ATP-dependent Lon protease